MTIQTEAKPHINGLNIATADVLEIVARICAEMPRDRDISGVLADDELNPLGSMNRCARDVAGVEPRPRLTDDGASLLRELYATHNALKAAESGEAPAKESG